MCVGFPGRVVEVDAVGATVDTEGRRRRASTLFLPDIAVGEWVYVAAGTIVERLEAGEAREIRATLLQALELEDAEAQAAARRGAGDVLKA
jgi:hydrogenase expression/formation protein HypC